MAHRKNPFNETTLTKDWLYQKYIIEGLGCPEIGALVDRDGSTIRHWLLKYGIPTRPRGSDVRQQFKKGRVSNMRGQTHSEEARAKIGAASRERGAVPYLKDGVHHLKGKRGAAVPNWKGGITPERQKLYGTDEWKAAAKSVREREHDTCQRCGAEQANVKRKFHLHHIAGFDTVKDKRADPDNLALLCNRCHRWVHSRANDGRDFLA